MLGPPRSPQLARLGGVAWLCWSLAWALGWLVLTLQSIPRRVCVWYLATGHPGCQQWDTSGHWWAVIVFATLAAGSAIVGGLPIGHGPLTRS
jgi:hypothetical protein